MVEAKTQIEYWQVPTRAEQALITNKEEEGGVAFVKRGKNSTLENFPKENAMDASWSITISSPTAK